MLHRTCGQQRPNITGVGQRPRSARSTAGSVVFSQDSEEGYDWRVRTLGATAGLTPHTVTILALVALQASGVVSSAHTSTSCARSSKASGCVRPRVRPATDELVLANPDMEICWKTPLRAFSPALPRACARPGFFSGSRLDGGWQNSGFIPGHTSMRESSVPKAETPPPHWFRGGKRVHTAECEQLLA